MKKAIKCLGLCVALLASVNAKDISGFSHPESVFAHKGNVFVSNVGEKLAPLEKDNDGFISRLDSNGQIIEKKFLSNLDAPKGMNAIGNVLYVVDIDRIKGFDIKSKKEVLNIEVNGAIFLNAIEVLNKNTLLVSDTGTGIIHEVDVKKGEVKEFVKINSKIYGGPNGLLLKKNVLYVAGYDPSGSGPAKLYKVDLNTKNMNVTQVGTLQGALDGIVFAKNGDLLVSDWGADMKGVIYRVDSKGNHSVVNLKKEGIEFMGGPADIYSDGKKLWIPRMVDNRVSVIDLP